ncbi:hypothetical protein TthWC1_1690 [Thermoanaerobacter thermohydrosulfuricus WC1]|jgi:hypothetical protein|uniref:Uncharacterized protein n=2 Tax=Thermoanaerobacter TaxID=1754 RepID=D3T364_THEIA|nr:MULTISPECIES: hypothetical protein [Thermoanaerobacter]ADD02666.1 conserved hypothetical protein [Thermoanaerobacter italicus Ab9]EMT38797.1 hypothetical protein TthWC1_1690 [Thermoanaerobacter thermohydrosulfuricus WC1]
MNISWGHEPLSEREEEYILKLTWKEKFEIERLIYIEKEEVTKNIDFLKRKGVLKRNYKNVLEHLS